MKPKIEAIIFDMDGTLYSFDNGPESNFLASRFGQTIHDNCVRFFAEHFDVSLVRAEGMYQDFKVRYKGEVSLGLEKEFGIDRSVYFAATWDLDPKLFITVNAEMGNVLSQLVVKTGVLTAAPRVWAERVLQFMNIRVHFGEALFTGDPDVRKPNPQAFMQLADFWELPPQAIIAIGDQEETDILPAQAIGMKTVRIGRPEQTQADWVADNVIQALQKLSAEGVL